jgi:hypothetical protein
MKKFKLFRTQEDRSENFHPGKQDLSLLGGNDLHARCLPLKIAGELGWDLKLPESFKVTWNGGSLSKDTVISEAKNPENWDLVTSSMGGGIITFKIPYRVDLEEGNFLWVRGGINNPLSVDLYPYEGLVESDWFPGYITMNYKILTPNKEILLEEGKSYCRMFPYPKRYIEEFSPEWAREEDDEEYSERFHEYTVWNRFVFGAEQFMRSYMLGYIGQRKVDNIKKITLSAPKSGGCPFLNRQ